LGVGLLKPDNENINAVIRDPEKLGTGPRLALLHMRLLI